MKRQPTDEQKQKAAARREQFKGLCKRLAGMGADERAKLAESFGAVVNCEGRALSGRNTFLVHLQRPGVSVVGGFRQWIKAGRCVMKGESALSILVPCGRGETVKATHEESGEGGARVFFITGSVFDVSQTRELEAGEAAPAPVVASPFSQEAWDRMEAEYGADHSPGMMAAMGRLADAPAGSVEVVGDSRLVAGPAVDLFQLEGGLIA